MKPLLYPLVALILNYFLLSSFPMAGGGASLGAILTIPIIAAASLSLAGIHYLLQRKKKKTKYFQICGVVTITFLSYFLFIADPGNKPLDVIARMVKTALDYKKIKLSDYFLKQIPINEERIIAAKKKFKTQLPDTAYTINVINPTSYTTTESIGIYYQNGIPLSTDEHVKIQQLNNNAIRLIRINKQDSLTFILTPLDTKINSSRISGFPEENFKGKDEKKLRLADISPINKHSILEKEYLAYRIFCWLL